MIRVNRYEDLGHRDHGWLDARHHFSFGDYHDPARMGFGPLRVINDDIVKAGAGFPPHPHRNMEIITYVRKGAISHKDSLGNEGRTEAGDVQVMSAGTGIQHAEFNADAEDINLYQIWIEPRDRNVEPRWDQAAFPKAPANDHLPLLVSGFPDDAEKGALLIHADAAIYGGRLNAGAKLTQALRGRAYALVSEGAVTIDGEKLKKGDGAEITDLRSVTITADADAELLIIDLPK